MCDFHFKERCFHPERVDKGLVAIKCEVHDCNQCTNKKWQSERISASMQYYSNILSIASLTSAPQEPAVSEDAIAPSPTTIFKNPFKSIGLMLFNNK